MRRQSANCENMPSVVKDVVHFVILVVRVRKYVGRHPEDAQMHKTNLNVAHFP
jgi:hypothetical protein